MISGGVYLVQPLVAQEFGDGRFRLVIAETVALEPRGEHELARAVVENLDARGPVEPDVTQVGHGDIRVIGRELYPLDRVAPALEVHDAHVNPVQAVDLLEVRVQRLRGILDGEIHARRRAIHGRAPAARDSSPRE